MLCDECGENTACVHMIKVLDGVKTEKHLCESCASSAGEACFSADIHFSVNDLVKAIFSQELDGSKAPELCCPNCGMDFADFSRSGRIGCSICYDVFHDQMDTVLRRVHGTSCHTGKVPLKAGKAVKLRLKVKGLRQDLERSVQREDYENAAQIRDSIRALESEMFTEGAEFHEFKRE
jgi:protein arginine kinase activator